MKLLKRAWPWILTVAALLALAAACGDAGEERTGPATPTGDETPTASVLPGPGVTDTEIKLGMTNDLTGTGGTPFGIVTFVIQGYFEKVYKEDGGVCGRKVNLVAEDDQYSPSLALEKSKKLVEQDKVLAMVGALGTDTHLAAVDYLNDPNSDGDHSDGIPDLFVSSGWSGWGNTSNWPWTIAYMPDYVSDGKIQGKYIADNFPDKKIGILFQDDALGQDYVDGLESAVEDTSLIVDKQSYEATATDITAQILNLRDKGAEIVFLASTPVFSARAIIAAHTQGWVPQFLMSYVNAHTTVASLVGGGTQSSELAKGFAKLAGTIFTDYLLSAVDDKDAPAMVEHRRIMETFVGKPVSTLSIYGQALAELIVETLNKSCDNLTREGLLHAAESIKGFKASLLAPGIEVSLGPEDHRAIEALQLLRIEANGALGKLGQPVHVR